ncbi:MAG: AMP-binding protein, partial [Algicola sp.]|nr:AMP-binding protein [Algicola sp.]
MSSTHPEKNCLTSFYRHTSTQSVSTVTQSSNHLSGDVLAQFCQRNNVSPLALLSAVTGLYFARIGELSEVVIGTPALITCQFEPPLTYMALACQLQSQWVKPVDDKPDTGQPEILVTCTPVETDDNRAAGPLSVCLTCGEADSLCEFTVIADNAYFSEAEATLLANRLVFLLEQGVADAQQLVGDMNLLPSAELECLSDYQQGENWPYPEHSLQKVFELQVEKTPNNVALLFDGVSLSYHELNQQANQLAGVIKANYLTENNPDILVALYFERGIEMVVSILAVLKAGGAYVPVSPDYPKTRTLYILADTATPLILSQSVFKATLDDWCTELDGAVAVLAVDDKALLNCAKTDNPPSFNSPRDLAYVIYTSGTTGNPKGVMTEHYSVVNLIVGQTQAFDFSANEVVAWMASYTFDASVEQLFLALLNGAALYVPSVA